MAWVRSKQIHLESLVWDCSSNARFVGKIAVPFQHFLSRSSPRVVGGYLQKILKEVSVQHVDHHSSDVRHAYTGAKHWEYLTQVRPTDNDNGNRKLCSAFQERIYSCLEKRQVRQSLCTQVFLPHFCPVSCTLSDCFEATHVSCNSS